MNWNDFLPQSVSTFVSSTRKERTGPRVATNYNKLENARVAMLRALSVIEPTGHNMLTRTRESILNAVEAQTLWYLRCDLLCLLSDFRGEPFARQELNAITEMFRGLVSESQLPPPKHQAAEAAIDTQSIEP